MILKAHHVALGGGGVHQVRGGVHLDVGVLGIPHRVGMHGIQQLVHGGGLGETVQKTKGGNPEAEFPPQICGPGLPPKIRVAQGVAQVNANHLGGEVEGCYPGHYIVHCKGPGLVGRLLHVVMGDRQGFVLHKGVGSSIGAGLQGRKLGESLRGHGQRKALRAVEEGNGGKLGKFVRISYEFERTHDLGFG